MFADIEAQVRAHLADVVPGVPVHGTWDTATLVGDDAPRLAVQVEYQGFDTLENKPGAVTLAHNFAVHFIVDAGRSRAADRAAAEAGLSAALSRLLAWPDSRMRAELQPSQTQFDGRAWRFTAAFTLAPVLVTAD